MANKYIDINGNQVQFTVTSSGDESAGQGVGLNSSGKLDLSVMPTGVAPASISVLASEAITAGSLINMYNNLGTLNIRNANATDNTKPFQGFILSNVAESASVNVYFPGNVITGLSGLTPGSNYYLSKVAGGIVTDVSGYSGGNVIQYVGIALSATQLFVGNPQFKTTV